MQALRAGKDIPTDALRNLSASDLTALSSMLDRQNQTALENTRKDEAAQTKRDTEVGMWSGYRRIGEQMLSEFPEGEAPTSFRFAQNGKRLPSAVLKRQVDEMAHRLNTINSEDFQREMQDRRERAAQVAADVQAGRVDVRQQRSIEAEDRRWAASSLERAKRAVQHVRDLRASWVSPASTEGKDLYGSMEEDARQNLAEAQAEYDRLSTTAPASKGAAGPVGSTAAPREDDGRARAVAEWKALPPASQTPGMWARIKSKYGL